jgi:hypothetical protein
MSLPDPTAVTVGDGTTFTCVVDRKAGIGGEDIWVFTDARGRRYTGPKYSPISSEYELRAVVTNWWAIEKALRQ